MESVDFKTVYDIATRLTVTVALIVFIYGGFKKWVVFGWMLVDAEARALKAEARYEKDLAALEKRHAEELNAARVDCKEWKDVGMSAIMHSEHSLDAVQAAQMLVRSRKL